MYRTIAIVGTGVFFIFLAATALSRPHVSRAGQDRVPAAAAVQYRLHAPGGQGDPGPGLRHHLHPLGAQVQPHPRSDQQLDPRRVLYDLGQQLRPLQDVLKVVQHQEQVLASLEKRQTSIDFRGGDRDVLGIQARGSTACCPSAAGITS